ncbi:MAG: transposase [Limisphaerales bacterium]
MKEAAVPTKKTRRKFDVHFKREAVALWQNSGKPAQEIAAQLGIREGQLYEWKKSALPALAQGELQAENAALRKENALLRQQRDILKKTLGIISEPLKSVINGSMR